MRSIVIERRIFSLIKKRRPANECVILYIVIKWTVISSNPLLSTRSFQSEEREKERKKGRKMEYATLTRNKDIS